MGVSDDEVIEELEMDRRWQLVLDCLDCEQAPFSKATLVRFRAALIAKGFDRRLIERTVEMAQNSFERYQALGHNESAAIRLRQLSNTQRQLAKNCSREEATALLQQAEHHLQQAIQLDTAGDYRENLAYDHIALALLSAEHLRWLAEDDASVPNRIAQFEQSYTTGFACLTELVQAVNKADEALDIARAYLEISPLENLDRAEALAHQSLQTFQDFNRRQLQASACKLLGEIYLARAHRQESGAIATTSQFLNSSLHLYRELDLTQKAAEVEQLMTDNRRLGRS